MDTAAKVRVWKLRWAIFLPPPMGRWVCGKNQVHKLRAREIPDALESWFQSYVRQALPCFCTLCP